MVCAVDMGSNTFKFLIAEIKNGKYLQHLDVRKTAGVGDDLKMSEKEKGYKVISELKIQEIKAILSEFQNECARNTHSRKMLAIATAAFREAENRTAVLQQLQQQGIDVKILTGQEESAYAYEAATLGEPGYAVVDVGSRTTEFVIKTGKEYQSVELSTGYKIAWDERGHRDIHRGEDEALGHAHVIHRRERRKHFAGSKRADRD
jgi:exopolyphosphatase/pppGpp-phosphohydrolase